VPIDVQEILQRSCYDCHSSATVWPWYSHVAPISWYVAHDVNAARGHINFQNWSAQINEQEGKEHLGLICKVVREGNMPPADYRLMHKGTDLSPAEISAVCAWSQKVGSAPDSDKKAD
ncbi:MAG: heme-binding domain-containing protein, partial [Candidatus Acidiferrales bacterium]